MNAVRTHRLAATTGLALAAAIAVWWLGSTRLALDHGSDAGRSAVDALCAHCSSPAPRFSRWCVRAGAVHGWRSGMAAGLALIVPSWPLVALAWSASAASLPQVALAELVLTAASAALPLIGQGLRHVLRKAELAVLTGTLVGVALAASVWVMRGYWRLSLP